MADTLTPIQPSEHMIRVRRSNTAPKMLVASSFTQWPSAVELITELPKGAMLLADKGCDANALRSAVIERKAWVNIPPKANRKDPICFSPFLSKARNPVERFYLGALKLVAIRIWLRNTESMS